MTSPAAASPVRPDRSTLPLLHAAVHFGFGVAMWPAFLIDGPRLSWAIAAGVGFLAAVLYWHPFRVLGFFPFVLTVGFATVLAAMGWGWCAVSAGVVGVASGFALGIFPRLRLLGWFLPPPRWTWLATLVAVAVVLAPLAALHRGWSTPEAIRDAFTLAAAVALGAGTLLAWVRLYRPAVELSVEPILWAMYHIRGSGPGIATMPLRGPCLIVANHACWIDPFILAKVMPRPVTPMMTSRFYDLPVMRILMHYVIRAIRVPDTVLKQDVPDEIHAAIAALDRGECVIIFPEGYLRRSEEKPLKRFGRGVWQILSARPDTPVFVCWIEGGWGSYFSYYNGKPTKSKKLDVRRPIGVGVSDRIPVEPALLGHHLAMRLYLMNQVAAARLQLGLQELPPYVLPDVSTVAAEDEADAEPTA